MKNIAMKSIVLTAMTFAAMSAARAEVVVIVNPKHAAASMTAAQVADLYLGKDGSLTPLDLKEPAALRSEFYQKVAGKDSAQVKAIWARLVFTGKQQPPKEMDNAAQVVKQVAGSEKAIGYVDKSAVDGSVKAVLTLN
jgi:ABC-type phosphate transport system substrate-binding protein